MQKRIPFSHNTRSRLVTLYYSTTTMSSSSSFRPLHGEQPAANDGNARQHPTAANVQATDRERDQRRHYSAQSSSSTTHRRTESSSQRTREHRKEKVEVTATFVRRVRSPDQRTRPVPDQPKHVRAISDANPYGSSRPKAKASRPDMSHRKSPFQAALF